MPKILIFFERLRLDLYNYTGASSVSKHVLEDVSLQNTAGVSIVAPP